MREEFVNKRGQTYIFTDTHFQCKTIPKIKSIPYDKISKIKLNFLDMLYVEGNGTAIEMFIPDKYKSRVKELIGYAKKNPQYFYNNFNFREEFISKLNEITVFTNTGIEYYSALSEEVIIDYKNMEPIVFNDFNCIYVQEINKAEVSYTYNDEDKNRISGPASYIKIENYKGKIGFISPISSCFCENCNRIRLTSNGFLKKCLLVNCTVI